MPIVADHYRLIVGVDTHAAIHAYAIFESPSGRVLASAKRLRSKGKTDNLDAITAARSTLVMDLEKLRDRRAGHVQTALRVLSVGRDQMNTDRLRAINALTALVRAHDLGMDAHKLLSAIQIKSIAAWRERDEPLGTGIARGEAVRLAKQIKGLDSDLKANQIKLTELTSEHTPSLLAIHGVSAVAAAIIMTIWSHPGRTRYEAALPWSQGPVRFSRSLETPPGIGLIAVVIAD